MSSVQDPHLDDEVIDRDLSSGSGPRGVDLLPELEHCVNLALDCQVVVGDGLLGLEQALGGDTSDLGVGYVDKCGSGGEGSGGWRWYGGGGSSSGRRRRSRGGLHSRKGETCRDLVLQWKPHKIPSSSPLTDTEAMAFCTSSATIRPSGPVPATPLSEIPACSASFLA